MNIRENGNFWLELNYEIEDDDIYVTEVGRSFIPKGLVVPPRVRNTYLLHFLVDGNGEFNGEKITGGQGFLIAPNQIHHFSYDECTPALHHWIAFYGKKAGFYLRKKNIELLNHTFYYKKDCFNENMNRFFDIARVRKPDFTEFYSVLFYMISGIIVPEAERKPIKGLPDEHIQKAIVYIQNNYYKKISLNEIADYIHVSPKYLSRIFSERTGTTLQEFAIKTKLDYAERLLKTDMKIHQIAYSIGYENTLNFTQIFKKYKGLTPSEYRKS